MKTFINLYRIALVILLGVMVVFYFKEMYVFGISIAVIGLAGIISLDGIIKQNKRTAALTKKSRRAAYFRSLTPSEKEEYFIKKGIEAEKKIIKNKQSQR